MTSQYKNASATTASIVDVGIPSFVRTSTPEASLSMVASPNTSYSKLPLACDFYSQILISYLSHQKKLYKIKNLTDEESTLLEPAACAIHGLDKLNPPVGIEVLLLGAGPTGLILAQLLKLNGASRVVIAANKGIKMDIARQLEAGDEYIELDRQNPDAQWQKLKDDNPYGFDVVVEATGVEKIADMSIGYVRRGGTLMIYGVYENKALVHWPPSKIFGDEITVSFYL
jgi:D-arabinitol dehydrogenase (NADP+)